MARISAQQRVQVRQALLVSAARHFAEHGLTGANINRISTDAGYAKGTVYNYFPSKEALFSAVLEGGSEQAVARYRARDIQGSITDHLLALAEEDVRLVRDHEDFMKTLIREMPAVRTQTRALIDTSMAPLITEVIMMVQRGQDDGTVRTDGAWPTWAQLPARTVTLFVEGAST